MFRREPIIIVQPRGLTFAELLWQLGVLAVGIASALVFYWALLALVQTIAAEGASSPEDMHAISLWSTALVFLLGMLPILRFAASDLPSLLKRTVIRPEHHYWMLVVLLLALGVLFLA